MHVEAAREGAEALQAHLLTEHFQELVEIRTARDYAEDQYWNPPKGSFESRGKTAGVQLRNISSSVRCPSPA